MRTLEERLLNKAMAIDGHLVWCGTMTSGGYGLIRDGSKMKYVHRVAWNLGFGDVLPIGDQNVLHKCGIHACLNPFHLYRGNQSDNMYDRLRLQTKSEPDTLRV